MTTTTTAPWAAPRRADNVETAPRLSEDWLSVIIGLFIFVLGLAALANVDLIGWAVTTTKLLVLVAVPSEFVTVIFPVVAPFGTVVERLVSELTVYAADVPLNVCV